MRTATEQDDVRAEGRSFALTTAMRQSLFYALLYAGVGASLPFIPLWLSRHGMAPSQISIILAIPLLGRAVTGPLTGIWSDRFERYRSPMLILALTGALAYGLMLPGRAYGPYAFGVFLALYCVGYTCINNIGPLLDAMTLQLARAQQFSQASARAWGSGAFVIANVALGIILQTATTQVVLIWIVCAALGLSFFGRRLLLPHPRQDRPKASERRPSRSGGLGPLLRSRGFVVLLIATGCLQAAHGFYYAFSTIIWKDRGFSSSTCGFLWAAAVAGEILFLTFGSRLRHRLGPWKLLIVASAVGVLRWTAMMSLAPLWLLWPLQLLHGLTFAAAYIAGLELVFCLAPKGYENLAQTVNSAYTAGLLTGLVTLASGSLFDFAGARAYGAMALLSLFGLGCAIWLAANRRSLTAVT
ncbi:MAG: MFS transporter [Asticcacaulis sp.]|nr:MFS transporter [Asticcacaulis sp.]